MRFLGMGTCTVLWFCDYDYDSISPLSRPRKRQQHSNWQGQLKGISHQIWTWFRNGQTQLYITPEYLNCWTPIEIIKCLPQLWAVLLKGQFTCVHRSAFCQIRRWLKKHPIIPLVQSLSTGCEAWPTDLPLHMSWVKPGAAWHINLENNARAMPITAWSLMFQQNSSSSTISPAKHTTKQREQNNVNSAP